MPKVIIASLFLPQQSTLQFHQTETVDTEKSISAESFINRRANNAALFDGVNALESLGQTIAWVGLPGVGIPEKYQLKLTTILSEQYRSHPVYIDGKLYNGHYEVFCKSVLWPLFHFTIGSETIITQADNDAWFYYRRVNELFAQVITHVYEPGDDSK